jgi:hypothetical protein
MPLTSDKKVYEALALPNEALENGGVEVLRAGIIDDELYVSARRAFKDPAEWGDLLAEVAHRVAVAYALDDSDLSEQEALAAIEEAFAAALGAPVIDGGLRGIQARSTAGTAKGKSAKKPARRTIKRRKR